MATKNNANNNTSINLNDLVFATKTRGASASDGSSACFNKNTRRLALGACYYHDGYRSGKTALAKNGSVVVVLSKNGYQNGYSAYHSSQHFITVLNSSTALSTLQKQRFWAIENTGVQNNELVLVLTPKN